MSRLMNSAESEFCREMYKVLSRMELTDAFNAHFQRSLTVSQITAWLKNHRVKSGRTGYFPKGHVSTYNPPKGTTNAGTFQKGHTPHNAREIGYEMIDRAGYVQICVAEPNPHNGAPTRMRHKHRIVWEQTHGEIPAGMRIKFLDGNRANCALENLILVEDAVAPKVRKVYELPEELRTTAVLTARLETAMGEK